MKKLNYPKTFLLGFGFFATSITWSIYNAFIPPLLGRFIESTALIGFIMTFDNYFAFFIQPAVGMYSDKINTRFGKRMPFLMVGMPLAVIFTALIPNHNGLYTLVLFLVLMNLSMSLFRSPVIALMPDITHMENRSKANSIINFMGGIGSVLAFFVGSMLWDVNHAFPFYLAAGLVLFSFIILFTFIKEKRDVLNYEAAREKVDLKAGLIAAFKNPNTKFLLLAICSWFIGYNGIETMFTRYGQKYLHVKVSTASMSFTFMSLSFLAFAIPAGLIGSSLGKKKTIRLGIIGIILGFFIVGFMKTIFPIRIAFIALGIFWALININSYPLVAEMAPPGYIGTYTGLYYLFSSIANIISPPLLGVVIDSIGYQVMFFYGALFFILALFFISRVKYSPPDNIQINSGDNP